MNKAYEQAMKGSYEPDAMWIYCEVCRRGFFLTKSKVEQPCEHIMARVSREKTDR